MRGTDEVVPEVVGELANGVTTAARLEQRVGPAATRKAPVDPIGEALRAREDRAEEERLTVDDGSCPFARHGVAKVLPRLS